MNVFEEAGNAMLLAQQGREQLLQELLQAGIRWRIQVASWFSKVAAPEARRM